MSQSATSNFGWQNKFSTTLASGITATDTTIPLTALPTPTEGFLVIEPDSSTSWEVIYYTSKTGSAVVCTSAANGRGVDDSTAASHSSGATVRMDSTAGMFEILQNGSALNAGALGGSPFATGWISSVLPAVSSVAANGNRSYNVTFASTVAAYLTPGMRLRLTPTVAPPTQCTSLNGTTQYYSKTSPAGMTFTDDFVVSAWVKLTSYGADSGVVSRYNGTSGWLLEINPSGQVFLGGYNAGSANRSVITSYQSIPLNKWVHIAAQLDMSAFTATTTTSYIMIDGVDVPASVTRFGTNPTALIQAGNLEVGTFNAGSFFPGKIAQVAIYSAKVTQATILASMNQTLAGTETSLISAYSFNNSINDLNANANNLTANGSAVATNADSPFAVSGTGVPGIYDFGIVTNVATTVATVQVPEANTIPTSGGVSATDLSAYKNPFGFPADKDKWAVEVINKTLTSQSSPVNTTYYNLASVQLTIPIGAWNIRVTSPNQSDGGASGYHYLQAAFSTSATTVSNPKLWVSGGANASTGQIVTGIINNYVSVSSATLYYLIATVNAGSDASLYLLGDRSYAGAVVECAYL